MNNIEIMKLALEALEEAKLHIWLGDEKGVAANVKCHQTITSLRQAIEQAQQAEPVAIVDSTITGHIDWLCTFFPKQGTKLYTSPPPRQPLADEEIQKCYETTGHYQTLRPQDRFAVFALARAIEAAHGIKGQT